MEREHGWIVSGSTRTLGTTLTADTAAGATVLPVYDVGHFDAKNGGTLSVNGATLAYSTCDDDADTITLTDPLPADALEGDRVDCWSTLYDAAFTKKTAMVQLDGDDDNPDPIEATVPHFLADKISDGDRGGPGESVVIEYDEEQDEWTVTDVRGLADASGAGEKHCNTDTFTVTAAGDQTITLSHTPLPESLDVKWHPGGLGGLPLTSAQWTVAGSALTVPDPTGVFAVGDLIDPQYDYRDGPIAPPVAPDFSFVGVTSFNSVGGHTSMPLPTGTQAGDLLVLVGYATPLSCSDARMSPVYAPDANSGVWVGVADGSGAPLAVNQGDDNGFRYDSVALCAFRGASYQGVHTIITDTGTTPVAVPSISAGKAILAWFSSEGTVSEDPNLTIPGYTEVAHLSLDTKTHAGVAYWQGTSPSPTGSISDTSNTFTLGGAVLAVG